MSQALTLTQPFPLRARLNLSLRLFWILSIISTIALLVLYIFQVNFLTNQIYSVQSSEEKLKNLELENETLKIDFSKSNSLANLEKYFSNQNFEKANPGQIKYIKILESEIVTR